MENKDMPAMALPNDATGRPYCYSDGEQPNKNHATGLTKREYFAAIAMQGIISSGNLSGDEMQVGEIISGVAGYSVAYADALLKELENESN